MASVVCCLPRRKPHDWLQEASAGTHEETQGWPWMVLSPMRAICNKSWQREEMIYSIENNKVEDLKFMKCLLQKAMKEIQKASNTLQHAGDYDRYCGHIESLIDLLSSEESLCDYFIIQKGGDV